MIQQIGNTKYGKRLGRRGVILKVPSHWLGIRTYTNYYRKLSKVARRSDSNRILVANKSTDLLKKQQRKFGIDWDQLRPILSEAKFECFSYYWMLVNSRCYYWPYAKSRKGTGKIKRLPVDDCMALCPFADYFNHASEGVSIPFITYNRHINLPYSANFLGSPADVH